MRKLPRRMLLLGIATTCLTGCAALDRSANSPSLSSACLAFAPLTGSVQDSTDTLRGIVAHNAAYEAVCGGL